MRRSNPIKILTRFAIFSLLFISIFKCSESYAAVPDCASLEAQGFTFHSATPLLNSESAHIDSYQERDSSVRISGGPSTFNVELLTQVWVDTEVRNCTTVSGTVLYSRPKRKPNTRQFYFTGAQVLSSSFDPINFVEQRNVQVSGANPTVIVQHYPLTTQKLNPDGSTTWVSVYGGASYTLPLQVTAPPIKPVQIDAKKTSGNNAPSKNGGKKPTKSHSGKTDPVDLFSGAYFINNVDLAIPGIIPIELTRYYSSAFSNVDGPFGKGTSLLPYGSYVNVKKESNGTVTTAPGTELAFSSGDNTEVTFKDLLGNLQFTSIGQFGFAGNVIAVQKDGAGLLIGAILSKPNGDKFRFDSYGDLVQITDHNNNTVEIARDTNHKIVRVQDPSTNKGIDLAYDSNGHITQATGLSGQVITYQYDAQGRLTSVTDPLSQIVNLTYDNDGQITTVTDTRGTQMVQNTYNPDGRVTHQVLGDNSTVDIAYPSDTTRQVTDGNSHVMEHRFEGHGLFTGYKTPLNQEYSTAYSPGLFDNSGGARTITSTDPQGRMVTTDLNQFNQPVRITDAAGRVSEMTYEPTFQLLSTIKDALGRITRFNYDSAGNVIEAIDSAGNKSTFTYNAQGQVLTATNALGKKADYTYDTNHNLTKVVDPLGSQTLYAYDTLARLMQVTDANGHSTSYTYDLLNRVTEITDTLGHKTTFAYDENGNVTSVTDPKGNTTTASFDPLNRLISSINAKGETTTIAYDAGGNVASSIDPKGQTTTYTYDAQDQVTKVEYADDTTDDYTYDNVSRLTEIKRGSSSYTFAYDILDRLITANTPQGSLDYTYDLVSRLTGFTSPNANYAPVQYAYDSLDRLTSISQNGKTFSLTYDNLGRRTKLSRPNGVESLYNYDDDNRLSVLTHKSPEMVGENAEKILEQNQFTYDPAGNITQITKSRGRLKNEVLKKNIVFELDRRYSYDPLDRLTSVKALGMLPYASEFSSTANRKLAAQLLEQARATNNASQADALIQQAESLGAYIPETASWAFDENGNIQSKATRKTGGSTETSTFSHDEADRLVSITKPTGTVSLNYDANGNLISDSTGRSFIWNSLDQLTQLNLPGQSYKMAYDPLGRRASFALGRKVDTFFYDGIDLLSDGKATFLHGAGLDEPLQFTNLKNGKTFTYLQDQLGSTTRLNDEQGKGSKRLEYTAYGKLDGREDNPAVRNPFTYTGREDDGTGLMYFRARYYDPELEVFISQDPMGDAQRYVQGNPILFNDPMGEWGGVDDAAFAGGGALVGLGSQAVSDGISGKMSGWEDYIGSALGGAVGGEAMLYTGGIASGAAGGAATNGFKQGLKMLSGQQKTPFNGQSLLEDTATGALLGKIPGVKIPGINTGRGSYNSIYKQMRTKFMNDQIERVSGRTAGKMFIGRGKDQGLLEGAIAGSIVDAKKQKQVKPININGK